MALRTVSRLMCTVNNQKPLLNVWVDEKGETPLHYNLVDNFQNEQFKFTKLEYMSKFFCSTVNFLYDIQFKRLNCNKLCEDEANYIIAPCACLNTVLQAISAVTEEVYNICKKFNLKLLFFCIKECPSISTIKTIDEYVNKFLVNKNFDLKHFKIVINAFDKIAVSKNKDMFLCINYFDKLMRHYVHTSFVVPEYKFIKKRAFDFSVLTGTLYERFDRVIILNELYKLNLLTSNFFYTLINTDANATKEYIEKKCSTTSYKIKNTFIQQLLQHKVFKGSGAPLNRDDDIYLDRIEWQIPHQVYDSYIHIVLETQSELPSITEKIFKPIIAGVPFVWYGCKGILKFLESLGYKRYNFINYDFDFFDCAEERRNMLLKEIKRLSLLNLANCIVSSKDVADHNREVFLRASNLNELLKL